MSAGIVPALRRGLLLAATQDTRPVQQANPVYEIIVLDNNPTDDTKAAVRPCMAAQVRRGHMTTSHGES
jgi:hypothetical protein